MTSKKSFGSAASGISTKAELEHRIKARPKPRAELIFTIGGSVTQDVHTQVNKSAEDRIKHLKERLGKASNDLKIDRLRAQLKDKSRSHFDRSREK